MPVKTEPASEPPASPQTPRHARARADALHWRGALRVGDYWATWRGQAGDAAPHRHFAAQAIHAPGGACVRFGPDHVVQGDLILIGSLVPHRLEPADDVTIHFLEPAAIDEPQVREALRPFAESAKVEVVDREHSPFWATWRAGAGCASNPRGARFRAVLGQIDAQLPDGVLRLGAVARPGRLSTSRFRHMFTDEVGLPFRRYVLWRRLRLAMTEIVAGADATSAAHAAGFADLSHLARTLKAMFGVTASQVLRGLGSPDASALGVRCLPVAERLD